MALNTSFALYREQLSVAEVLDTQRRLHIGGWQVRAGWEILDANPGNHVNHVGDAADLSRFASDTFCELYASHILEHFDFKDELDLVLREWHRVLQPGGKFMVSVPDLECLCRLYVTPGLAAEPRYKIMQMIFGSHLDHYDYHMVGLDFPYLLSLLQTAGFSSIQRVQNFNLFRDTSSMEFLGVPISLNMTAVKPQVGNSG